MQTDLADFISDSPKGRVADSILRKCVHCGFCSATCPTYLLLGNELDGPRGRIYLIKQVLEGAQPTERTQLHLDRCLTCRSCETTCPSGVRYGRLLEIGREVVDEKVPRKPRERFVRSLLMWIIPNPMLTQLGLFFSRTLAPFLPNSLRKKIPPKERKLAWSSVRHERRMIIHQGCIQRSTKPQINSAASRYLDASSISSIRTKDTCCGALGLHLGNFDLFKKQAKTNIDAWLPHLENGVEAIVSTASACGATLKDYGELLADDEDYAEKAQKIASSVIDISEVDCNKSTALLSKAKEKVAFHSPCTLQHGQKIVNKVEEILGEHGFETVPVEGSHLCCGSAGAYSLLQSEISEQLLRRKIDALEKNSPDCIVTANIGCLMHLNSVASVPVKHWVEIVASEL